MSEALTSPDVQIFPDAESLALAAAAEFVTVARQSILARGRFVVALSGGSTPKKTHTLLAERLRDEVDWAHVWVLFGDERFVPPTDPDSNERMARETLLSHVSIPAEQILPMYREGDPAAAAAAYADLVGSMILDLTFLGLGTDGHTASLFPGHNAVHETERMVVAAPANAGVAQRITMTPPFLNRSREILFLVAGADKAEPLNRVLTGKEDWNLTPAQAIARHAPYVKFFVDAMAAAGPE